MSLTTNGSLPAHMLYGVVGLLENYTPIKELAVNSVYLVQKKENKEYFVAKVLVPEEEEGDKIECEQLNLNFNEVPFFVTCFEKINLPLGRTCIIMEYCSGGNLAHEIAERKRKKGFFTDDEVCKVVVQIGRGLSYLHNRKIKILHRDIKPENILLAKDGNYKLGDFGLAAQLSIVSRKRSTVGTDGYMAPEVYQGMGYNEAADVFSFGLVLYEMVMLEKPYYVLGNNGSMNFSIFNAASGKLPHLQSTIHQAELITLIEGFLVIDTNERLGIADGLQKKIIIDFIARTGL